jgi:aspartate racemase
MRTIGLFGGLTWHSSIDYDRYINQSINKKPGGDDVAPIILFSVNYGESKKGIHQNNWQSIKVIISDPVIKIENAGAEQKDCNLPVSDTALNHASSAAAFALS